MHAHGQPFLHNLHHRPCVRPVRFWGWPWQCSQQGSRVTTPKGRASLGLRLGTLLALTSAAALRLQHSPTLMSMCARKPSFSRAHGIHILIRTHARANLFSHTRGSHARTFIRTHAHAPLGGPHHHRLRPSALPPPPLPLLPLLPGRYHLAGDLCPHLQHQCILLKLATTLAVLESASMAKACYQRPLLPMRFNCFLYLPPVLAAEHRTLCALPPARHNEAQSLVPCVMGAEAAPTCCRPTLLSATHKHGNVCPAVAAAPTCCRPALLRAAHERGDVNPAGALRTLRQGPAMVHAKGVPARAHTNPHSQGPAMVHAKGVPAHTHTNTHTSLERLLGGRDGNGCRRVRAQACMGCGSGSALTLRP